MINSQLLNTYYDTEIKEYSNGGGYGVFCFKKCQQQKKAQGIEPRYKKNQMKKDQVQNDAELINALKESSKIENGISTGSIILILSVSLIGLGGLLYLAKRMKG